MTTETSKPATPPVAKQVPLSLERHGVRWTDCYAWLRDPGYPKVEDPEILAYLEAENAYFDAVMAPQREMIDALHAELKGRIKDDDSSVPVPDGAYLYHWAFKPGAQYRTWYRAPRAGGRASVILDEPALADGKSYFNLGGLAVSPDWLLGLMFGIGGGLGMYVGARLQKFLPSKAIKSILALCVLFVAGKYIFEFIA